MNDFSVKFVKRSVITFIVLEFVKISTVYSIKLLSTKFFKSIRYQFVCPYISVKFPDTSFTNMVHELFSTKFSKILITTSYILSSLQR